MTYHLVEFTSEESAYSGQPVAIIPGNWLVGQEQCLWPPKTTAVTAAMVVRCRAPEDNWKLFSVKILYSNENYSKVKAKESEAFDKTDLSSTEDERPQKRKRVPKRFTSTDESSGDEAPPPPKRPIMLSPTSHAPASSDVPVVPVMTPPRAMAPPPSTTPDLSSPPRFTAPSPVASSSGSTERLVRRLLQSIGEIKIQMEEMGRKIDLLALKRGRQLVDEDRPSLPTDMEFPLMSQEDLEEFNRRLGDTDCRKSIVMYLASIGGAEAKDVTRRILSRLITNKLAMQYNMTGTKGKSSFKSLGKLKSAIHDAVTALFPMANEKSLDGHIVLWLHSARDRDGGRVSRRQATTDTD